MRGVLRPKAPAGPGQSPGLSYWTTCFIVHTTQNGMASFSFRAIGTDGALFHGELDAPDRARAVAQLHASGATPLRVQPVNSHVLRTRLGRLVTRENRISQSALVKFLQRLATLLGGGVSIEDALAIMTQRQGAPAIRQLVQDLLRQLREGAHLADAMARHARMPLRISVTPHAIYTRSPAAR